MKSITYAASLLIIFITLTLNSLAQLPKIKIDNNGDLRTIESEMLVVPPLKKYDKLIDSLDKNLKLNPADTTSLFYRALIYYSYNQMLAKPAQRTKGTLENLTIAKSMIEKAIDLKMIDFKAKLLRAQIYNELCYRFLEMKDECLTPLKLLLEGNCLKSIKTKVIAATTTSSNLTITKNIYTKRKRQLHIIQ